MSAIVAENVSRRFGEVLAVDDVSLEVGPGEVVAVLGRNSAGKTTMLEMLEGYLAPSDGRVSVLGADPRRAPRQWRARIGVVLQSTSLDRELTVGDALSVFARLFAAPRPVAEVLELIGLERDAHMRIRQLSGGQRRRVDLGVAIIGRPELLFLDEPTTGLDPAARRGTWATVEELAGTGTTVVLTTHYMEEAQRLADRLVVLAGGRVVADATPDDLRASTARSTVRLPVRRGAPALRLPTALAPFPNDRDEFSSNSEEDSSPSELKLLVEAARLPVVLTALLDWAGANGIDLRGLEVAPPTIEDTYLALTARAPRK